MVGQGLEETFYLLDSGRSLVLDTNLDNILDAETLENHFPWLLNRPRQVDQAHYFMQINYDRHNSYLTGTDHQYL